MLFPPHTTMNNNLPSLSSASSNWIVYALRTTEALPRRLLLKPLAVATAATAAMAATEPTEATEATASSRQAGRQAGVCMRFFDGKGKKDACVLGRLRCLSLSWYVAGDKNTISTWKKRDA